MLDKIAPLNSAYISHQSIFQIHCTTTSETLDSNQVYTLIMGGSVLTTQFVRDGSRATNSSYDHSMLMCTPRYATHTKSLIKMSGNLLTHLDN